MWKVDYDRFRNDVNRDELISYINKICDGFLESDEFNSICDILGTTPDSIDSDYNARQRSDGTYVEQQLMKKNEDLEQYRSKLFPLFNALGFYQRYDTELKGYNHIVVLGGTYNAGYFRTSCAKEFVNSNVKTVDGLTCYRPINPIEKKEKEYNSNGDTEFGALSDAFVEVFNLGDSEYEDKFTSNRNINSVTNIRTFEERYQGATLRLYACPSLEPDIRRANTGDCIRYYVENNTFKEEDKVIFVSNSRYCNRQFLQIIYYLLKTPVVFPFDIVAYTNQDCHATVDKIDLSFDVQELIAIIDWVNRFKEEYN